MKKKIYLIVSLCCLFLSCQFNKTEIERIAHEHPIVITENMESMMPGELIFSEKYLLWTDPFHSEKFVHIINPETGEELTSIIKKGEGPQEFLTPDVILTGKETLFVYDQNSDKTALLSIDKAVRKENPFLESGKKNLKGITRGLSIHTNEYIFLEPGSKTPFVLEKNNIRKTVFGKQPVESNIENGYDVFQGVIAYSPAKEKIVYTTFRFPYMAVYKKCGDSFCLEKESLRNTNYNIKDNKFFYKEQERGAKEMCLLKDYIVTLERDRTIDSTDENKVGRDFSKLPHTIFLYDYDLNLKKIINLGMPILRLASSPSANTLYTIGVNPDFVLMKYEL